MDSPPVRDARPNGGPEMLLVVARGHRELLEELQSDFGARMRVIEDRRQDRTLLPRDGRDARGWRQRLQRAVAALAR